MTFDPHDNGAVARCAGGVPPTPLTGADHVEKLQASWIDDNAVCQFHTQVYACKAKAQTVVRRADGTSEVYCLLHAVRLKLYGGIIVSVTVGDNDE